MASMSSMAKMAVAAGLAALAQALPSGLTVYTGILPGRYMIKDYNAGLKTTYTTSGQEYLGVSGSSVTLLHNDDNSGNVLWAFIPASNAPSSVAPANTFNIMCSTWLTISQNKGCFLSRASGNNLTVVTSDSNTGTEWWTLQFTATGQLFIVSSNNMMVTLGQNGMSSIAQLTSSNTVADSFNLKQHNGIYWVYNAHGADGGRTMLSVDVFGTVVDLWPNDDGSGRQEWVLTTDFYGQFVNFMVFNGVTGPAALPTYPKYMNYNLGNPAVNLVVYDSSQFVQWNVTHLSDGNFNINLQVPALSPVGSYLGYIGSSSSLGANLKFFPTDQGSITSQQQWKLVTHLNIAGTWNIYTRCSAANSLTLGQTGANNWIVTQIPGQNVYTIQTSSQGQLVTSSGTVVASNILPFLCLDTNHGGAVGICPAEGGPNGYTRWYINQPAGQTWFYIQPANIFSPSMVTLTRPNGGNLGLIQMDTASGCEQWEFDLPVQPVPTKRINDGWIILIFFWALIAFCCLNCCLMCCVYILCCKWRGEEPKVEEPIVMDLADEGATEHVADTNSAVPHAAATGDLILAHGARQIEQEEFFELSIFEARQKKQEVMKETEVNGNHVNRVLFEQADNTPDCGVTCL